MTTVRIAAVQVVTDFARPFAERVEHVTELVTAQQDVDLVVLPELWATGAFQIDRFDGEAQPIDGPLVAALAGLARTTGAWLHGGSFVERDADGRLFNTSVVFDDRGELRATYRKLHLFGFAGGESTVLSAGDDVVTCPTPFGVVGLSTCYDLRFPELYRTFVDRSAVLALVPAAWPERRTAHWQLLARARAVENQLVVVGANTAGTQDAGGPDGPVPLAGRSVVLDAWGDVLAEAGPDVEDVLRVMVDLDEVARTRERFPVLRDRRL